MSAVVEQLITNFRPMTDMDLDEVLEIENVIYNFPWSQVIFHDCLRVGYCCWVMENKCGDIEGYGVMSVASGECHILNLCVQPQAQGIGLGGRLLEYLLDVARMHGADTAFLEVRPSNEIAKNLYLNSGFNEVGMRRDYYPARDGREDAIIMAYSLREP